MQGLSALQDQFLAQYLPLRKLSSPGFAMSLARAVPYQDEFLVSDIGAEYRPQSAESAKGLVADAALKIYDQTAAGSGKSLPQNLKVFRSSNVGASRHRQETYGAMMENVTAKSGRIYQERLCERDLAKQVADALVVDFGSYKATHKRIANIAGATEKTAENWTSGMNMPHLVYFLRLLPHSPALQGVVRKLCHMESGLDPDFQQAFTAFMALVGKR